MYAIRYKELVKKDEGINNNMAKKRDKKNKLRGKWLRGIIIVYLFLILCNLFHEFPSRLGNLHSIPVSEEWYLIVVNRWNEIPEDYRVELTELSNGQKVDSRIYPYLQEMFDAARKDGIYPVVREGYRTYEEQQKILDDKIKAYINEGYSQSRAERTAKEWVALPGTSEHQLGIAVDINADAGVPMMNSSMDALREAQKAFAGEAEKASLKNDDDVMAMIKELREESVVK